MRPTFILLAALTFSSFAGADDHTIILRNHCITCHDQVLSSIGRLDLSRWIRLEDGTFGFPHEDAKGRQKPALETFQTILARITTQDANKRMPLGDTLTKSDLETLTSWINQNIKSAAQKR